MKFPSFLFLGLVAVAAAATTPRMVVHESRENVPDGFVNQGPASPTEEITLRIALTWNDLQGLEERFMAVSDPRSESYGLHLSQDEVNAFITPADETISQVAAWLSSNGLTSTSISPAGDWISITLPISKANSLLSASFHSFLHPESGTTHVRTMAFSIPSNLVGHIEAVHPTTAFVPPPPKPFFTRIGAPPPSLPMRRGLEKRAVPASCASVVTPACLQALYGIPTTAATQKTNMLTVTGYVGQFAQQADLTSFLRLLRPDIPSTTAFTLQTLDGGSNPQSPNQAGVEADLDIQYTIGVATDVPTNFLSVGRANSDFLTSLMDTVTFLQGVTTPPTTMTTSYGGNENGFSQTVATRLCNSYMTLGARGVSIMFASGDGGVRGNHDSANQCTSNTFLAVFPASCPFVTSVGATTGIAPEVAVNFTGGGFSNFFSTPSYQSAAVSAFQAALPSNFVGTFNKNGRGWPDVSAQGLNFEIVAGGTTGLVSGTSCSSPSFAGLIALVNDERIASGKKPLGFLNPVIYQNPGAFNDVVTGRNPGFTCSAASSAFSAGVGWDPLTGLGTPKFASIASFA